MEFHPQKCSYLRISRSRKPKTYKYIIKGVTLAEKTSAKYLGVEIQSNLAWNNHIDRVTKKSNNLSGFLIRNIQSASSKTKTNTYITMVRSNLEYCASAWNPHQKMYEQKIEMVQRRAASFSLKRYHTTSSMTSMLDQLSWEPLKSRRIKLQLTNLYKIQHNLIDVEASKYFHQTVNHSQIKALFPAQPLSDQFKFSLFLRTIIHWNSLPGSVAEAPSLAQLKRDFSTQPF